MGGGLRIKRGAGSSSRIIRGGSPENNKGGPSKEAVSDFGAQDPWPRYLEGALVVEMPLDMAT